MSRIWEQIQDVSTRVYKVLFVPYALAFLLYLLYTALVAVLLALSDAEPSTARTVTVVLLLAAPFVFLIRFLIRRVINYRARRRSLNPSIILRRREVTLRYRDNCYVDYARVETVRLTDPTVRQMKTRLFWAGPIEDVTVADQGGCSIIISPGIDFPGTLVTATLPDNLMVRTDYQFKWTVTFKDKNKMIRPFIRMLPRYMPEDSLIMTIILAGGSRGRFVDRIFRSGRPYRPVKERYSEFDKSSHSMPVVRPVQRMIYFTGLISASEPSDLPAEANVPDP